MKCLVDVKVRTEMIGCCEGKNWNDSWCEGKNWND